jgi:NAD(P)-dependent dehydrogenase (short-subunit alcohol dehydrogenase family)
MRFQNKVALITGAGSGIGRAIACRFAEEGADIAVHDVAVEGAAATGEMILTRNRRVETYQVDVSRSDQVQEVIAQTIRDFGRVHTLVNCAGINIYRRLFDFSDEEWNQIIGVDLTGTWNYCRYLGPHLVEKGGGSIVNISSVGAFQTSYYRAPYMASKGGVSSLTKAMALDLAESNVRVNAVAPGLVKTGMSRPTEKRLGVITEDLVRALTPMRRWAAPEEVANAVLFLASDDASFITGQDLAVDGGITAGNQFGMAWKLVPEDEA